MNNCHRCTFPIGAVPVCFNCQAPVMRRYSGDNATGLASPDYHRLPGAAFLDDRDEQDLSDNWTTPVIGGGWNYTPLSEVASSLSRRGYFYSRLSQELATEKRTWQGLERRSA